MTIDYSSFKNSQKEDAARIKSWQVREIFQRNVREHIMFLESYVNWYGQPVLKTHAMQMRDDMNKRYSQLISSLEKRCTEELFFELVKDDREETLRNLKKYFGTKPLPRRLDDPYYQHLHPKTKKEWGIRRADGHDKF